MLTIALAFFLAAVAMKLEATELNCERVGHFGGFKKCCYLNETTAINAINATFAGPQNYYIDAILFRDNKKIQFLPVNVYKKFTNLVIYLAGWTSVRKISAVNFVRLSNLEWLDLHKNNIEFIPDDCFQGLNKLNHIDLSTTARTLSGNS